MTTRTLSVLSRLIAIGAVAAALVAAGPAAAADNPPVDANGKRSCELYGATGSIVWVPHDTVVTTADGQKFKCADGQWVKSETGTRPAAGTWSVRAPQYGLVSLQVQATKA